MLVFHSSLDVQESAATKEEEVYVLSVLARRCSGYDLAKTWWKRCCTRWYTPTCLSLKTTEIETVTDLNSRSICTVSTMRPRLTLLWVVKILLLYLACCLIMAQMSGRPTGSVTIVDNFRLLLGLDDGMRPIAMLNNGWLFFSLEVEWSVEDHWW